MTIYQFRIELAGSHHKIWRRVQVESNLAFDELHPIIKISMGWEGDYPYEFIINDTRIHDLFDVEEGEKEAMDTYLDEEVSMVGASFTYLFNDRWEHRITLEEILSAKDKLARPVCTGGEGAVPPADCGGILHYHEMLSILADEKHPEHHIVKKKVGNPEGTVFFNIKKANAALGRYTREWQEIYNEAGKTIARLEGKTGEYDLEEFDGSDDFIEEDSEYESIKHFTSPPDLLDDEVERLEMEGWIEEALRDSTSIEYNTFNRLLDQGHEEKKSMTMILEVFAIEWFYELKYGMDSLDNRYEYNLSGLPEPPREIPSLEYAIRVLDTCTKGIPFSAIEYLHNDPSPQATSAIVKALNNFSDHKYCWEDCTATPIWYSLAAEGHLCEALIDPVITLFDIHNEHESDWLFDQGQYLIGKLAQKYPDTTTQKVLAAMEKDAEEKTDLAVYYLFDVFYFCDIDRYKDRLIALLKRIDISWHDSLASTVAFLQIKEGLPVLKEQQKLLKGKKSTKGTMDYSHMIEIEEAVKQLETGENLYPDVDTPICLKRGTTWNEEFADAEKYFYATGEDEFDLDNFAFFEPDSAPTLQQTVIKENKIGRNDPCPCGSGKKYKKCCLDKDQG